MLMLPRRTDFASSASMRKKVGGQELPTPDPPAEADTLSRRASSWRLLSTRHAAAPTAERVNPRSNCALSARRRPSWTTTPLIGFSAFVPPREGGYRCAPSGCIRFGCSKPKRKKASPEGPALMRCSNRDVWRQNGSIFPEFFVRPPAPRLQVRASLPDRAVESIRFLIHPANRVFQDVYEPSRRGFRRQVLHD